MQCLKTEAGSRWILIRQDLPSRPPLYDSSMMSHRQIFATGGATVAFAKLLASCAIQASAGRPQAQPSSIVCCLLRLHQHPLPSERLLLAVVLVGLPISTDLRRCAGRFGGGNLSIFYPRVLGPQ